MKRLKIFSVAVISVLLMIIISSNIFAAVQSLNSNGTLEVKSAAAMYAMNNVMCVEHGQILTGEFGTTTFKVKCSIHIRGRNLTLKKWNQSDCTTSGCTCSNFDSGNGHAHKVETFDGYNNGSKSFKTQSGASTGTVSDLTTYANKFAGIFYTNGLENGGTSQYGGGTIAAQQLTVWYAWNGFVNRLPSDGIGDGIWDWGGNGSMKAGSGNISGLSSSELSAAKNNWGKIDTTKEYAIDLYYLDCGTGSWQALMLYDKNVEDLTIDIPVKKVWNDDNNRDGKRPNSIEVELLKNGNPTGNKRTLSVNNKNSNNEWIGSFTNLPKQENGRDITYSVREYPNNTNVQNAKNAGYTESVSGNATSGFTITNTYVPEKTSISVEKVWEDGDNRDVIRPSSIQVTLNDGNTSIKTITLNEQNGWKYEFTDLYKYKNGGTEINYNITEVVTDGYSGKVNKTVNGNKISIKLTNTHDPEEVEIPVKKVWDDDTDRDGLRPSSIKLTLKADGVAIQTHTLSGTNDQEEWSYTFTSTDDVKLYKYKNVDGRREKIVYTVEEEKITNSQSYDPNQKYENPVINPASVTAKDGDTNKITDMITITNKHIPEKTSIIVRKHWDDDNNRDDMRTESISFRLKGPDNQYAKHADGTDVEPIVLNEANGWEAKVENLFRYYNHGTEINYTLEEVSVPAEYTYKMGEVVKDTTTKAIIEITGINHHDPELIEIPITKTWDDDTDRDGLRPDSIQLELWADKGTQHEKLVQTAVITGSENENTWSYTFKSTNDTSYDQKIFKYRHNGILIKYTIVEIKIRNSQPYNIEERYVDPQYITGKNTTPTDTAGTITGSTAIRDTKTDGFEIINKHEPERTRVVVQKQWNDDTDLDEYRPDSIELELLANGERITTDADGNPIGPIILKDPEGGLSNTWEYTVENLFRYYDHGKTIDYTVIEKNVPDHYNEEEVNISKQEYTPETGTQIITITKPNTHEPHYDGYIEITGKVWLDLLDGKANKINGIQDEGENGIAQVKVMLKAQDGSNMNATYSNGEGSFFKDSKFGYTAQDGTYTIRVNYDNSNNVYKLYEDASTIKGKLNTAYVEFEYDGMTYTTVKDQSTEKKVILGSDNKTKLVDPTSADQSKAIENEESRLKLDTTHNKVVSTTKHPDKWTSEEKAITATTKDVIKSFDSYMSNKENYETKTSVEVVKYCNGNGTYIRTNPEGAWNSILKGDKSLSNHRDHTDGCKTGGHTMRTYTVDVEVIKNVNLGLFVREQPDISIRTELSKVELEMKGQHYTYLYNSRTTATEAKAEQAYNDAYNDAKDRLGMNEEDAIEYARQEKIKTKFEEKGTYEYRRPVNPADIAYIKDETAPNYSLKVRVSYDMIVGNSSPTLTTNVHSIKNYYDSNYKLESCYKKQLICTENHLHGYKCYERGQDITNCVQTSENTGSPYNTAYINLGETHELTAEAQYDTVPIELTYSVNIGAIKAKLLQEKSTLNNAVEIDSYSTEYGERTLYAEQRTGGRTGNKYAGYDYDSHPGDAENRISIKEGRIEISEMQDDEDIAPAFTLVQDESKILAGNVWEDTDANGSDEFRVGDGKKSSDEKNLGNAKIELYHPIINAEGKEELVLAKLYSIEGGTAISKDAIAYSDESGNYTFGDDSWSVLTDTYVFKFTYGEGIPITETETISSIIGDANVNARNYKSTIISKDTVLYNVFNGSADKEWHLNIAPGYSVAVDKIKNEGEDQTGTRSAIKNLIYSNFENEIYVEAYSKPFDMQVEFDPSSEKTSEVDENGNNDNLKNDLAVFDFGIIEQARENIIVEKTIEDVKLRLANGNMLIQGNPADNIDYVNAPGLNTSLKDSADPAKDALRSGNKAVMIQVDSELIQGAQLELKYAITVINKSEKDYNYETNTRFYYYGETEGGELVKGSVNMLVDYMDNSSKIKWHNDVWELKTVDQLDGYISGSTKEILNTGNYNIYTTNAFEYVEPGSPPHTEYATVTRTLTGTEDENLVENHAEILEIGSKVARTIKGRNESTGAPIVKAYRMGNYVPSLENTLRYDSNGKVAGTDKYSIELALPGLHEQDDDRIKVTVTGPTGITTYIITYLVAGLAGLIVLVIGVVIIKKKVLTK